MSRQINLDEKLSPEDHEYFRGRWDVTSLRRNMMLLGVDQSVAIRAEYMTYDEYESAVAEAENAEPAPAPEPQTNGSTPVPASISAQQEQGVGLGATGNDGDATSGDEAISPRAFADESLAGTPYDKWTNDQLRSEITKRNEMREGDEDYAGEEPMTTDGVKADLVARLEDDDEADAPE
jgi:hypothetical protein